MTFKNPSQCLIPFSSFPLSTNHPYISPEEIAALVFTVNPEIRFSDEQLATIVREMIVVANSNTPASASASPAASDTFDSISLDGLRKLYSCGAGDLRRDLDVLGISQSALAAEYYEKSAMAAKEARAAANSTATSTSSPSRTSLTSDPPGDAPKQSFSESMKVCLRPSMPLSLFSLVFFVKTV